MLCPHAGGDPVAETYADKKGRCGQKSDNLADMIYECSVMNSSQEITRKTFISM